jgi:hypothetical protein
MADYRAAGVHRAGQAQILSLREGTTERDSQSSIPALVDRPGWLTCIPQRQ